MWSEIRENWLSRADAYTYGDWVYLHNPLRGEATRTTFFVWMQSDYDCIPRPTQDVLDEFELLMI